MSQYETTPITPGEQQTGLTTEESYNNIDPSSANYQASGHKKSSMLGKLKDKTKKAGSAIKSKVGHKKSHDGATTPTGAAVGGEEMEDVSDDSADAASPVVQTTPYTGPASVPREFGTFPSQGRSESKETDSTPAPDMSGLSLNDSSPSATDKASEMSEGAKDSIYGGAAATAGALGVGGAKSRDDESKPFSEKASDASSEAAWKAEDAGQGGYKRAGEAKDAAAEKGSEVADQTKETAYETKDAAQSKAADLNNATDDSQTYTEKASNTATAAKDTVADKLGMNQPSTGPSLVDQAKGYFGSAVDTTKEKTGMNQPSQGPSLMDKAKGYFGSTVDTTKEKTGAGVDTTKDYAAGAKDTTMGTTASAADTTKDYAATGVDTTKDYTSSAYDKTANAAQGATDTSKDYATRAKDTVADATTPKDEHKALSEKITDSLSGLTAAPANSTTGAANDETNPGILGKLTGMLGYAQKAPGDHPTTTSTPSSDTTTTTTATQ